MAISLCSPCERYLLSSGKPFPKDYWPAMVWAFLSYKTNEVFLESLPLKDRWALIPMMWRHWWHPSVSMLEGGPVSLHNPPPLFCDKTLELNAFENAISRLKWIELAKEMDKHLAYPEVRCPWGCSEFLHKCNRLSFEEFLYHQSNWTFDCYRSTSTSSVTRWTDCMRPDFPSAVDILENTNFLCEPTVVVGEQGVEILACGKHTSRSRTKYLYPPRTMTGSLFTVNSNQLSPAICRSRTLRHTKLHHFSDTYQTGILQGGYDGIDSSYVSNRGNLHHTNALALLRDSLSIKGRSDIQEYVRRLSKNPLDPAYVPSNIIARKLAVAKNSFPDLASSDELKGATYIALVDAIELQEQAYQAQSQVLKVYNEENGESEDMLFSPPWPRQRLRVHPYDGYGERFAKVSDPSGTFIGFVLLGLMTVVDEIWSILTMSVKTNREWIGWWLAFAAERSKLPGRGRGEHKKKLFSVTSHADLMGRLGLPPVFSAQHLFHVFQPLSSITVVHGDFDGQQHGDDQVMIVVEPTTISTSNQFWEIQCLFVTTSHPGVTGERYGTVNGISIFARHSGQKWWCQPHQRSEFGHSTGLPTNVTGIQVAVYCRRNGQHVEELRRRYLKCLGGQNKCYCGLHMEALITNACRNHPGCKTACVLREPLHQTDMQSSAFLCERAPLYVCPEQNCKIGICGDHWENLAREQENPGQLFFLTEHDCIIGSQEEILQNSEVIVGDSNITNVEVATLGPTEAHEVATDLFDEDDDVNAGNEHGNESIHESDVNEDDVNEHAAMIPTTNTARHAMGIDLHGPTDVISSPLHVLLNMQGHLLIRRNTKLRMRKRSSTFYERIVSRSRGETVPLVYAEALLFPDIFYYSTADGSILGSLPTALWTDETTLAQYGIASMRQHGQNRISDPSHLCSTDPRYQFLTFDVLVNLGLRGNDSRLILHRGFADRQNSDGIAFRNNDNAELYGDSAENTTNVHKLSALLGHRPPHYFFTQSCNQKTCRGLRLLRQWTTSQEAAEEVAKKYHVSEQEAGFLLRESAAPFVLRSWNEVSLLWMKYIVYSLEAPLHEIEWAWWRHEFQEKQGNPSHIHAILRTKIDISTAEGLKTVLLKIRGSLSDLIHYNEIDTLKAEGFISSSLQLREILTDAEKYLTHQCHDRCQVPKVNRNGETHFVCKVPNNFWLTNQPQNHSIQPVQVEHSNEACGVLRMLSMMNGNEIVEDMLKARRHIPPSAKTEAAFSPTNGRLFMYYPSSQNLQFTTGYSVSAYLAKYVAELDEVALVKFAPPSPLGAESNGSTRGPETNNINGTYTTLHNTKITSWKNAAHKTKSDATHGHGRALTQMECLTVIQGTPLVTSTVQFIHMPTCPREYRAALFNRVLGSGRRPQDMQAILAVVGQTARLALRGFPPARLFSSYQMATIQDELRAPLTTDVTTYFGMRPPELRFVREQKKYLRWFQRETVVPLFDANASQDYVRKNVTAILEESEWLDGFNCKLRLRLGAVNELLCYAQQTNPVHFGGNVRKQEMVALLLKIKRLHDVFVARTAVVRLPALPRAQADFKAIEQRFLSQGSRDNLPVVWHTPVYPKNRNRFLIHLLLAMGSFETEYELMLSGSLRAAFIHANLFDPTREEESIRSLTARYVREFLAIQPGSTFQFDRNLCLAYSTLKDVLCQDTITTPPLPSVLYSHMVSETRSASQNFQRMQRSLFIDVLCNDITACGHGHALPEKEQILLARQNPTAIDTTTFYPPQPSFDQNTASYTEQRWTLLAVQAEIDAYINPAKNHKNVVVVGGPGTGKTTLCEMASLYALCKGLNGIATSIVADRAKQLGGIHLHRLGCMKQSGSNLTPGRIAENALAALYRNPDLLSFWQTLDFFYIDELGLLSAEQLAVYDLMARYIKHSALFMGGMLVIGSEDILQLMPWQGTPIMMSLNMIVEFQFFELVESVRAANCPALREICTLTRNTIWSPRDIHRFQHLLSTSCTFVTSLADSRIPEDAVFIFGRREPCLQIEKLMLRRLRRSSTPLVIAEATDEESTTGGNWHPATPAIVKRLSRQTKRKRQLVFYENARFEFCHNDKHFQQGQLAILLELNEESIMRRGPIYVWAAPPGCKDFPPVELFTQEALSEKGWKRVRVLYSTSENEAVFRGIQGRRTQYGLKPRVAATIHASMGSTLSSVATQVTNEDDGYDYTLWEAAQVVVLLSRTRRARDIYFVGDPLKVAEHLLQILRTTNRFLPYIRHLLHRLTDRGTQGVSIVQNPCMYRPCDAQLPTGKNGVVYQLVSTRDTNIMYIGETENIRRRLTQHNSGDGSSITRQRFLQPWAVYAIVLGFRTRRERQVFESTWKVKARSRQRHRVFDAETLLHVGHDMANEWNRSKRENLRVIQCGYITSL